MRTGEAHHIMPSAQFPVRVRTGWVDYSPAVHTYAGTTVARALGGVAAHVRSVTVRIADYEPHDPATRLCAIEVELTSGRTVAATATGRDVHGLIDGAAEAVAARLRNARDAGSAGPLSRIA